MSTGNGYVTGRIVSTDTLKGLPITPLNGGAVPAERVKSTSRNSALNVLLAVVVSVMAALLFTLIKAGTLDMSAGGVEMFGVT